MEISDPGEPPERKKRTVWLLAAGAVSLLIPLAGAIYLHISENAGAPGPSGRSDLFERRDGADLRITPTQTAVVPLSALTAPPSSGMISGVAKSQGSSLDFIKSNDDLKARLAGAAAPAAPPAASTVPAVAPPAPAPATVQKTAKPGKKPFIMPKLQPTRGFTNFGSSGANAQGAAPAGAAGGQSAQDMLKNLPPGAANNPAIQQYLQNHPNGQ